MMLQRLRRSRAGRVPRRLKHALLGAGVALACGLAGAVGYVWWPLPGSIRVPAAGAGFRLTDRHGMVLRDVRAADGSRQGWVPFAEMDADLIAAFLAAEDGRFFDHAGVDARAVFRAARDNLQQGRIVSGASTITMQLARMLFGSGRDWGGKLAQALQALRLERHLNKQEILERYLNLVPLGQGAVGVPAAARLYFGASAREVSLGQAALLAGIARVPSTGNPMASSARAAGRRAVVLDRLVARGYATAMEAARARAEPVLRRVDGTPFLAPHFTTRVLGWRDSLTGAGDGLVRTSLDLPLQAMAEVEVAYAVAQLRASGGRHAAAVILSNATGEILAWVGSPDFFADTAGQVDMVVSPRQPGSALKPFLYGAAFDRGYTAASILPDIARTYATRVGPYRPRNYDRRLHGPVRIREALASSYNIPAVELTHRLGPGALLGALHQAGFTSLDRRADHYGLGLALGNGDVTLLELANGYRVLANGGVWSPVSWRPVDGHAGPVRGGTRVMSAGAAALVLDILNDRDARIPGFGVSTPFDFPFPVAVKTGTSRHYTDNWAVGVTGRFTVAVWVGDFSGRPMDGVSGVSGAGPLLHRVVLLASRLLPPGELPRPDQAGLLPATVCRLSGHRAGPACPERLEWFLPGTGPDQVCDWHRDGGVTLPAVYAEWAAQTGQPPAPPRRARPDPAGGPFRITSPQDGDRYRVPPGVAAGYATIALRASGGAGGEVQWTVNGRPVPGPRWTLAPGRYQVAARAASGARDRVEIEVVP